ncbi:MAG: hypothetical protein PHC35_06510 [Deltaproteobacteria bacterium]|jgi:endoglucanase|nr:hypothetical protein [Deltaproteobacteria bacterium]
MDIEFLKKLTGLPGVSGNEGPLAQVLEEHFKSMGLSAEKDCLGNLVAHLPGNGPRLLLDAHMDEVGMMVQYLEPNGFVRFIPVGGLSPVALYGQPVVIWGKEVVCGVIGSMPPHLNGKDEAVTMEELFIDTGIPDLMNTGLVSPGDSITFAHYWHENGLTIQTKALDNRLGVFVLMEVLSALRGEALAFDLWAVVSVQEEMGLKGASALARRIKPDIAVVLEGTVANDLPGVPGCKRLACLGAGVEIRLSDARFIADRQLAMDLVKLAQQNGISHQVIVKKIGGTNAAAYQVDGVGSRAAALSVPVRYIHSAVGMAMKQDIGAAVALVSAFLKGTSKN